MMIEDTKELQTKSSSKQTTYAVKWGQMKMRLTGEKKENTHRHTHKSKLFLLNRKHKTKLRKYGERD